MDTENIENFVREMESQVDDRQLSDIVNNVSNSQPQAQQPPIQQQVQMIPQQMYMPNIYNQQIPMPPVQQQLPVQVTSAPSKLTSFLSDLKSKFNVDAIKLPVIVGIVFIILSLPQLTTFVVKYVPALADKAEGINIAQLATKTVVIMIVVLVFGRLLSI